MKEVTDPSILEQLNSTKEVTDPNILAQLNGSPVDPTSDMHWYSPELSKNTLVAGFGSAFPKIWRGAKQLAEESELRGIKEAEESKGFLFDQSKLDKRRARAEKHLSELAQEELEARKVDAPLMNTGGGLTGNILGNVAAALPSMAIPGANTVAGSGLIGGVYGALQPTAEGESRNQNAMTGAALSGGLTAAAKGIGAGYRGVKSMVEPFTDAGQEKIAARTLQRFAGDVDSLGSGYKSPVPGVNPTLAESTLDPGIATLQRATQSADPQVAAQLAERQLQNNAARIKALGQIAGDDSALEAAKAARSGASSASYESAKSQVVPVDATLQKLLSRPSMSKAWEKAQQLAIENGDELMAPGGKEVPVKTLHYLKMGLDDMLDSAPSTGLGRNEKGAIQGTKQAFLSWLENLSPEYGAGRTAYAEASKPITQMEVGRELLKKGASATEDALGNPTLYPEKFARAIRDSENVVRSAGGIRNQTLENVLTPEQLSMVQGIGKDLSRQQASQNLGRAVGSNTVQNLSSKNIMSETGIPKMISKPLSSLRWLRPMDFSDQDTAIRQKLADILLNPEKASQALKDLEPGQAKKLAEFLKTYALPPAGASILPSMLGAQTGQQ